MRCHGVLLADDAALEHRLRALEAQNSQLLSEVRRQQQLIESLSRRVAEIGADKDRRDAEVQSSPGPTDGISAPSPSSPAQLGNLHLSGEGGIGFFATGPDGFAPHPAFRVDEARLFLEAPVWDSTYFYGETDFATRENNGLELTLGELYVDIEDVSQLWGRSGQLNARLGRMNVPFGEEYLSRYAISNPLISHSLSDLWGYDAGLELYGGLGKFSYVAAVQNGSGANGVQDFTGDKSVAGRISYDPAQWLHLSISAMRTGDLNPAQDRTSALWFGNGFFRSLGSAGTKAFHANLVEGDVRFNWRTGHLAAFGGFARYGDDDPLRDNGRDVFYYSVEAVQNLPARFYLAARFSDILAGGGFPIVGNGDFGDYFFDEQSVGLWRLSLGLGYRLSEQLALKTEYTFEQGREVGGAPRDHEDFFGTEAVFQF